MRADGLRLGHLDQIAGPAASDFVRLVDVVAVLRQLATDALAQHLVALIVVGENLGEFHQRQAALLIHQAADGDQAVGQVRQSDEGVSTQL